MSLHNKITTWLNIPTPKHGMVLTLYLSVLLILAMTEVNAQEETETWPSGYISLANKIKQQNVQSYEDAIAALKGNEASLQPEERLQTIFHILQVERRRSARHYEYYLDLFQEEITKSKPTRYQFLLDVLKIFPADASDKKALEDAVQTFEKILQNTELDPGQRVFTSILLTDLFDALDKEYRNLEVIEKLEPTVMSMGPEYIVEKLAFFETQYYTYVSYMQGPDTLKTIKNYLETASKSNLPLTYDSILFNAAWVLLVQEHYDAATVVNKTYRSIARRSQFAASTFIPNIMCIRIARAQEKYETSIPCIEEAEKHLDEWIILAAELKIEAARAFANLGQSEKAKKYLEAITPEELIYVSPTISRTTQEVEALIQYAEGNYKAAFNTYRDFNKDIVKRYDDLNNRTTREIRELSLKETKALKDLNFALENKSVFQQKSIERVQFYLNIVILIAVFSALLIGLLGYQILSKQKLFGKLELVNNALSASLKERELLLQEIHHRIKNNLQLITSLLNLQDRRIKDDDVQWRAKRVIREINGRVHTMSLIHKELYRSQEYDHLNVAKLIKDLTTYVISLFSESTELNSELDDVVLGLSQAMPMGLIACEVLTNCLEHGRSDDNSSKITISLKKFENTINLKITDNGPGFAEQPDFVGTKSLGLLLIRDLTRQVGGEFSLYNCPEIGGVCFDFTAPIQLGS